MADPKGPVRQSPQQMYEEAMYGLCAPSGSSDHPQAAVHQVVGDPDELVIRRGDPLRKFIALFWFLKGYFTSYCVFLVLQTSTFGREVHQDVLRADKKCVKDASDQFGEYTIYKCVCVIYLLIYFYIFSGCRLRYGVH